MTALCRAELVPRPLLSEYAGSPAWARAWLISASTWAAASPCGAGAGGGELWVGVGVGAGGGWAGGGGAAEVEAGGGHTGHDGQHGQRQRGPAGKARGQTGVVPCGLPAGHLGHLVLPGARVQQPPSQRGLPAGSAAITAAPQLPRSP